MLVLSIQGQVIQTYMSDKYLGMLYVVPDNSTQGL